MSEHLNIKHRKEISDLEAFFIVIEKLINNKIEEGSKGIIIAKGQTNERRIRYTEIKRIKESLEAGFGLQGAFSFGTCQTCTKFDSKAFSEQKQIVGKCKQDGKIHSFYNSCENHSIKGGGWSK